MSTTTQQSISPVHPTLTTPKNKNTVFPQTTIQTTVKPSVFPKYSQMDYQTFRPITTSRKTNKQKTSNKNNLSDHNYNFFQKSEATKPLNTNSQIQSQSQNQNVRQQASQSLFFNHQPRATLVCSENYPFFQQQKTYQTNIKLGINHITQMTKIIIIKINDLTQIIITITGTSINQILSIYQIFSNHIHETNEDKQNITQPHTILIFNHKTH